MEEESPAKQKPGGIPIGWRLGAFLLLVAFCAVLMKWDVSLMAAARERENHFVPLHFMVLYFSTGDGPPHQLADVFQPSQLDLLLKPFHGNIAYKRTGEDAFVLEEPEERWVSLVRKDRMVGDASGCHWLKSGAALSKR
jgi:hypothetical protein